MVKRLIIIVLVGILVTLFSFWQYPLYNANDVKFVEGTCTDYYFQPDFSKRGRASTLIIEMDYSETYYVGYVSKRQNDYTAGHTYKLGYIERKKYPGTVFHQVVSAEEGDVIHLSFSETNAKNRENRIGLMVAFLLISFVCLIPQILRDQVKREQRRERKRIEEKRRLRELRKQQRAALNSNKTNETSDKG